MVLALLAMLSSVFVMACGGTPPDASRIEVTNHRYGLETLETLLAREIDAAIICQPWELMLRDKLADRLIEFPMDWMSYPASPEVGYLRGNDAL